MGGCSSPQPSASPISAVWAVWSPVTATLKTADLVLGSQQAHWHRRPATNPQLNRIATSGKRS